MNFNPYSDWPNIHKIKSFFIICPSTPIFLLKVMGTKDIFDHSLIIVTFNRSGEVNLMGAFNFIGTFACLVFQVFSLAALFFNFLQNLHTGVSSDICVNNYHMCWPRNRKFDCINFVMLTTYNSENQTFFETVCFVICIACWLFGNVIPWHS